MKAVAITLPDGSRREYPGPVTPQQIAASIGRRLEEAAVAAKVDGKEWDFTRPIEKDSQVAIITRDSREGLEVIRHSTAHLLAMAVKELYPGTQITIGPVIEEGFYYDIDCPIRLTDEELPKIEKKMEEIAKRHLDVTRVELPREEMIDLFKGIGDHYKVELIEGFNPNDAVTAYRQGEFIDLCRGPHVHNTSRLGKFKLLSLAGAYWRGDEKNKMLQRIYGTAYASQKELDEHLKRLEEARKRDHRKLGPEIGLFTFLDAAPAMPFYLPKGTILVNLLTQYMRGEMQRMGYQEVICPQLMSTELWMTSGHWENYRENMFLMQTEEGDHKHQLGVKPMNCPGHCALFASQHHSYRDLPLRLAEFTKLHRNERAGVTHGLLRTRAFSQDDAHIFCTEEQLGSEALAFIQHVFKVYEIFGFDKVDVKLATRPEKFLGTVESWDRSIAALDKALRDAGREFTLAEGEGAFYGPKIEFHIRDSIGRYWQCGTLQLDANMPERFKLEYIGSDNQPKRPVMLHRAVLGSLERFMGILIEHHAGHLPLWINPVQAVVINVTPDQEAYAREVTETLKSWGLRVHADTRNEKLGYKIREAQLQKTPLMLVLGAKEAEARTLSVRKSSGETTNDLSLDGFREFLQPLLNPGGNPH